MSKDLNIRDKWCGLRAFKTYYKPIPYQQQDRNQTNILAINEAEAAAHSLSKDIWGHKPNIENFVYNRSRIIQEELEYNISPIISNELREVSKKFKRRKAPGPDEGLMEVFKDMDDGNLRNRLYVCERMVA